MRMLDIHSHIVFAVDDGSEDLAESVAMLDAAKAAGIDCIYATPHMKSKDTDVTPIHRNFLALKPYAEERRIALRLGFEYNISAIDTTRFDRVREFVLRDADTLLLEMPFSHWPPEWRRIVTGIQKLGLQIIVAHPERYLPVQRDHELLDELVDRGCLLQCNASSILSSKVEKRRAVDYIREMGRLDFVATDAHSTQEYGLFRKAVQKVGAEINYPAF